MMKKPFVAALVGAALNVWSAIVVVVDAEIIVNTDNPVCFICGALNTIATNLSEDINIPVELNLPIARATCEALALAGLRGLIPTDVCYAVQASDTLRDLCGCIELPDAAGEDATGETSPIAVPPADGSSMPAPCYICGSETAVVTNRDDAFVTIPEEFNAPISSVSCSTLEMIGLGGLIPPGACLAAQASSELQTICGCEDPAGIPAAASSSSDYPSDTPSDIPSASAPSPTPPVSQTAAAATEESNATKTVQTSNTLLVLPVLLLLGWWYM